MAGRCSVRCHQRISQRRAIYALSTALAKAPASNVIFAIVNSCLFALELCGNDAQGTDRRHLSREKHARNIKTDVVMTGLRLE
jgi:hypothetical protein